MKNPKQVGVEKEPSHNSSRVKKAMLASALAALALFAFRGESNSGEVISFPAQTESTPLVDDEIVIVPWNMHNEAPAKVGELKAIDQEQHVDAFLLTEVSRNDAKALSKAFPRDHIEFVMADKREKSEEGGYGNLIMTDQAQTNVDSISLPGRSGAENLLASIGHGNLSLAAAEGHESRSALASTIQLGSSSGLQDVRLVVGHLSPYPSIRELQIGQFQHFVDEQREEAAATIFAGDMNASREEMFEFQKDGWIIPQTGPTFTDGKSTLDYVGYSPGDLLDIDTTEVLYDYQTDHHPILSTWEAN